MRFICSVACLYVALVSVLAVGQSRPIPLINQPLVPASAAPGGEGLTLTINGTGFNSTSEAYWNGSIRQTTVVSSSQVQTQISAADIADTGFGWVTVGNLGVGGEEQSNVVYFPIRAPVKGIGFVPANIQNTTNPGSIAVGDFNNDGLLDFALGSEKTIQVFPGKGDGTFQSPIVIKLAELVNTIVAGDFDGDGNLDLAALTVYSGSYSLLNVFLGKGDGTFTRLEDKDKLSGVINLSTADFNGDGKLDLYIAESRAVQCHGRNCFIIFLGNGDGTFSGSPNPILQLPVGTERPAIADFNGDGNLDIAVAGVDRLNGKGVVDTFLGDGKGSFTTGVHYAVDFAPDSVTAADVNGDGKIDLITDGVSVLFGNGDGTFSKGKSVASGGSGSVNVGDFNGDGKLDIVSGLSMLFGNGDGTFDKPVTFAGMKSGFPISLGAFNSDGQLDLLGINAQNGTLSIFGQHPLYFGPTNLDFGSLEVGTTSPPQTATVTNFRPYSMIVSINITGANSADFSQKNNCGSSLPSNASCKIRVTFTPRMEGQESALLNATQKNFAPLSMPLSGTGIHQTLTVTLTPSSLNYGTLLVGTTSPSQTATLTNTGNQPVTISSIVTAAPFNQTNNCPSTLPVDENCQIQVTFTPTDYGVFNGMLSVTDNAVGSPQTVELIGTGTAVVLSPTRINFGNEKVGTSSVPIPVTLNNLGTSSLTIAQIAIKGADPNDFAQTNNCGTSVPARGQCTITITFTPTAKGPRAAKVNISDSDPNSPQTVPLSGKGT